MTAGQKLLSPRVLAGVWGQSKGAAGKLSLDHSLGGSQLLSPLHTAGVQKTCQTLHKPRMGHLRLHALSSKPLLDQTAIPSHSGQQLEEKPGEPSSGPAALKREAGVHLAW